MADLHAAAASDGRPSVFLYAASPPAQVRASLFPHTLVPAGELTLQVRAPLVEKERGLFEWYQIARLEQVFQKSFAD